MRASNLGGAVARAIGPLLPVTRVADTNLRLAHARSSTRRRGGASCAACGTISAAPSASCRTSPALRATASGPGWEMVGDEIARAMAAARGGPVIFFSGHLGNWEMPAAVAGAYGIALSSAYRARRQSADLGRMITALRRAAVGRGRADVPEGRARRARRARASDERRQARAC